MNDFRTTKAPRAPKKDANAERAEDAEHAEKRKKDSCSVFSASSARSALIPLSWRFKSRPLIRHSGDLFGCAVVAAIDGFRREEGEERDGDGE